MIQLLTRRNFLQAASIMAASQAFPPALKALSSPPSPSAWIAGNGGIHCLRGCGTGWLHTAFVECELPSALAIHAASRTLYVTNATETYSCLPTGSISSYRVLPHGDLELLHRQELSLACVRPDALAVSPEGDRLVIASSSAGILNVLPLNTTGLPCAVTAVRKELGWANLGQQFSGGLALSFVDGTFVAENGDHAMRYRCALDELAPLGKIDRQFPRQAEIRSLATAAIPKMYALPDRPAAIVLL